MSQLKKLLESANPYKSLQSDAVRLANKWSRTGLLEGIGSETDKNNMSMILENQAKQLVTEESVTGGTGTFTAGTGGQWAGVALPLVRKVFGQIAAKEFVSVQPMNLPSGLVFFLDFQYGTNKTPFVSGDSLYGNTSTNFGNTNTGGLYGAGRFAYSINQTSSVFTATTGSGAGAATWADFDFDSNYSSSFGEYKVVSTTLPTTLNADTTAVRSFQLFSASVVDSDINTPSAGAALTEIQESAFTKLSGTTLTFVVTGSQIPELGTGNVKIAYSLQPLDNKRGDFEAGNTDLNSLNATPTPFSIPEINVQMRSEAIVAKTRKLKAVWTPEFAQDLNAYHSLDAEAELTSIMSEYISLEIDLEIMDMLIEAAPTTEYWSAQNNKAINPGVTAFDVDLGFFNSQGQWFQTLGTKMQKVSNIIHQKTLRGGANFLVCSPTVATVLESIPGYASTSDGDASKSSYAFGIQKSGAINNRYTVYKNPYMTENTILMGFRGGQFLEAGAVFAPYIPLIMTPLVYDPDTFTPRKGLLTRYAKKVVRPEYYAKILVSGLNTL